MRHEYIVLDSASIHALNIQAMHPRLRKKRQINIEESTVLLLNAQIYTLNIL